MKSFEETKQMASDALRIADAEKGKRLLETARCLSEYWNLDEWIAD